MSGLIRFLSTVVRMATCLAFTIYALPSSSAESFTYLVPEHWQTVPDDYVAQFEAATKQGMESLEGHGSGYQIEDFNAFAIGGLCIILIYNLMLPKGSTPTGELIGAKELSKRKFEAGKKSGVVEKIISIKNTKVGDMTGNVFEWVGKTEKPLKYAVDTSWHHPSINTKLLNISAQCAEKGYADGEEEIFNLIRGTSVQ